MFQQVIIEPYIVSGLYGSTAIKPASALQLALNDGWRVVSSSSATLPSALEEQILFVTFILEKAEEQVTGPPSRSRDFKKN